MLLRRPLISIITPTYNAEKYIEKCVASVRDQAFTNYEHIIVDGGSTDKTTSLLKDCDQRAGNLRLFIGEDDGIYDAMNKGIRLAAGEWLYFLGADDFLYDDGVLEKVGQAIAGSIAQLIYGNVFSERLHGLYDGEFDIEKILTRNLSHQAVFYHTSVFKSMGLYNLNYPVYADYDLNIRCWLSGQIDHLYIPVTIAVFGKGGTSSMQLDERFNRDYPFKTIDTLFAYERAATLQISILSRIFRKILQRYPLGLLAAQIWKKDHLAIRLAAIAWMFLSLPFHIIRTWIAASDKQY